MHNTSLTCLWDGGNRIMIRNCNTLQPPLGSLHHELPGRVTPIRITGVHMQIDARSWHKKLLFTTEMPVHSGASDASSLQYAIVPHNTRGTSRKIRGFCIDVAIDKGGSLY
jgi:hypothetical protein